MGPRDRSTRSTSRACSRSPATPAAARRAGRRRRRMTVALRALEPALARRPGRGAALHGRAEGAARAMAEPDPFTAPAARADRRAGARARPASPGGCRRRSRRSSARPASRARHDIAALPRALATPGRQPARRALVRAPRGLRRPRAARAAAPVHRRARGDARALPLARGRAARGHGGRAVPRRRALAIEAGGQLRRRAADLPGPPLRRADRGRAARHGDRCSRSPASTARRARPRCTTSRSTIPAPVALLVDRPLPAARRQPAASGAPSRRPAFRRRFGRLGADLAPGRPLRELVEAARRFAAPAAARAAPARRLGHAAPLDRRGALQPAYVPRAGPAAQRRAAASAGPRGGPCPTRSAAARPRARTPSAP